MNIFKSCICLFLSVSNVFVSTYLVIRFHSPVLFIAGYVISAVLYHRANLYYRISRNLPISLEGGNL